MDTNIKTGPPRKILVVEDDATMRDIVVRKFKLAGYNVLEADNGKIAVKMCLKEKPDLVLLDLMLPELDGFGVLLEIRNSSDSAVARTPVVALTNLYSKEHVDRATSLNVQGFFVKAYVTTEEIVEKITQILDELDQASNTAPQA